LPGTGATGSATSGGSAESTSADADESSTSTGEIVPSTITDPTTGADTTGGVNTEVLVNGPLSTCTEPLWCFIPPNPMVPIGDPIAAQECFVARMPPPFLLRRVTAQVGARSDQLGEVNLEIRARDGGRPGALLAAQAVDPGLLQVGLVDIELVGPLVVDTPEICVGFDAPGDGLAAAIGFAVDTESTLPGVSFVRMSSRGGCDVPQFSDVIALAPVPTGNWCFSAEIESLP
jgi:hypothetical protein